MFKLKDLRQKTLAELQKLLIDSRQELTKLRLTIASGKNKNQQVITVQRKLIARILTLIRENELKGGV